MKLSILFLLLLSLSFAVAAPPDTVPSPEAAAHNFFTFLLGKKHDIVKDAAAQGRWLTKDLRQELAAAVAGSNKAARAHPGEQIDSPDNGTFLAAWDPPTEFKVTKVKTNPPNARVDLQFIWGPKTQYPGEKRMMTAVMALEDGAWKIRDVQVHAAKFNQASTVSGDLAHMAKQR